MSASIPLTNIENARVDSLADVVDLETKIVCVGI